MIALAGICSVANANPYLGVAVGQAKFKDTYSSYNTTLFGNGSYKLDLEDDDSTAAKLFVGYQFNDYFAIEGSLGGYDAIDGSYVSIGDMTFLATQAKGILPIGDRFNLFVKGGSHTSVLSSKRVMLQFLMRLSQECMVQVLSLQSLKISS